MVCKRCQEAPLDIPDVARYLGISVDTVHSHYRRGTGGLPDPDYLEPKPMWFPSTIRKSEYGSGKPTPKRKNE